MDLNTGTATRANAQQFALALQVLGARIIEVSDSVVVAKHGKITVNVRLCRENIPFAWWINEDGDERIGNSFACVKKALGLNGYVRTGTILARALRSIGLTNRGRADFSQDFYIHGEYNAAGERLRTYADFRSRDASVKLIAAWEELKPALDLTGYCFELKHYTETLCYIRN